MKVSQVTITEVKFEGELRAAMKEHGITDAQLAANMGVDPMIIKLIREGNIPVGIERAIQLCRGLGMTLQELFGDAFGV
jgi:transcriptional regulator with XRE-family HTH domain